MAVELQGQSFPKPSFFVLFVSVFSTNCQFWWIQNNLITQGENSRTINIYLCEKNVTWSVGWTQWNLIFFFLSKNFIHNFIFSELHLIFSWTTDIEFLRMTYLPNQFEMITLFIYLLWFSNQNNLLGYRIIFIVFVSK